MIFIYPASISENCDKRIVPAVAKSIERFFCTQICDAIADGVLPLSRKWEGRNYGPIVMECVNNYNEKQLVTESCKYLLEDAAGLNSMSDPGPTRRKAKDAPDMYRPEFRRKDKNGNPYIDMKAYRDAVSAWGTKQKTRTDINTLLDREANTRLKTRQDIRAGEEHDWKRRAEERAEERHGWEREEHGWRGEKNEREAARERRDVVDWNEERQKGNYKKGGGNYMPLETRIDIVPTGMVVEVPIQYVGGRLDGRMDTEVRVNINVKVIPTIIKNFKILERDLLDDYFRRKSENYFISKGRNIARKCYNVLKRLPYDVGDVIWEKGMMTLNGDDVSRESRKDIIYNSHGFVNASAFHKTSKSPNNYNYTSNIVVFNKDDLTDPEDSNIFQNRSAMARLFKLGWSTFCMLDPVEEIMYFISSLDGGYMHVIPYRYLMESYGSRAYYGTETKLKDAAKPFLVKRGNFLTFAKQFKKKSKK